MPVCGELEDDQLGGNNIHSWVAAFITAGGRQHFTLRLEKYITSIPFWIGLKI